MLAKFETYFDGEDWCARGIGADIFTQGTTLDELMDNTREAAELHFEDVLRQGDYCASSSNNGQRHPERYPDGYQSSDRGTKEEVDRDAMK